MAKKQDYLCMLKGNKKNIRFTVIERILKRHAWKLQSTNGSHHIYSKTGRIPILIVKPHGNNKFCHPMDVNKVILELEIEEEGKEL